MPYIEVKKPGTFEALFFTWVTATNDFFRAATVASELYV